MLFYIWDLFIIWDFVLHVFSLGFFRPGIIVKLYFPVPVKLYTVLSVQKTLAKNPGQKSGQNIGHADHVLKT